MRTEKKRLDVKELEVLFPHEEVELAEGVFVEVRPLSLHNLPKVADSFGTIMKLAESGSSPSEIAASGLKEVLNLIQFCIDLETEDIPAQCVPDILEVVIKQNMSSDIVKKWMALVQKMQEVGQENDLPLDQSKSDSES